MANTLAPLYTLLQKGKQWAWGKTQQLAFEEAKKQLTSEKLLVHFDASKELLLSCDASPYGIGAVLSHRMKDGSDHKEFKGQCTGIVFKQSHSTQYPVLL